MSVGPLLIAEVGLQPSVVVMNVDSAEQVEQDVEPYE